MVKLLIIFGHNPKHITPFWDDTKPREFLDQGGYVDFRNAFNISYNNVPWNNLASKQDGYLKRPLYQTDRDVNYIYNLLSLECEIDKIRVNKHVLEAENPSFDSESQEVRLWFANQLTQINERGCSIYRRFSQ